jgi:hypothetical protein
MHALVRSLIWWSLFILSEIDQTDNEVAYRAGGKPTTSIGMGRQKSRAWRLWFIALELQALAR